MEKTLIIIKPGAIQRDLSGEIIRRFERKGLQLCGLKMIQLDEDILNEHYGHLIGRSFFPLIKESMMRTPVIVCCWEGYNAVEVARHMTGATHGRQAELGTIRGDFSVSVQENIIHASDCVENAELEVKRFFLPGEVFDFKKRSSKVLYAEYEK